MIFKKELDNAFNKNFVIYDENKSDIWIGKLSRSLKEKGVSFSDLNNRAILAHRLMNLLDIPFPEYKIIKSDNIEGLFQYKISDYISSDVWLSKNYGTTLDVFLATNISSFKL